MYLAGYFSLNGDKMSKTAENEWIMLWNFMIKDDIL